MIDYGKYKIGAVVRDDAYGKRWYPNKDWPTGFYGHITGFAVVEYDKFNEVILKVMWCDGDETTTHPTNVEVM